MPSNDAHFSGQGHLIEAVVYQDPNNTVIPVVCDAQGRLIIDLTAAIITIGKVDQGLGGISPWLVHVDNFPAVQPVSGTFWQAIQPVSGTVTALQGTSPWLVSGSGTFLVDGSAHTQPVSGTFFQATQPISGNVGILGTVPISGSVSVSNFPATQNVDVINTVPVTGTFFQTTQPVSETNVDRNFGTWGYYAGTNGSVTVTSGQRVLGIGTHATTAGSFTINGGSSIPVPAGVSVNIQPLANLVAPTIVFTGTDSYFIEVVS
jgi:hypothetical protein